MGEGLVDAIRFVLSNGIRRTIKDAVMRKSTKEQLARHMAFEDFLEAELGEYMMQGLVEKFWETRGKELL